MKDMPAERVNGLVIKDEKNKKAGGFRRLIESMIIYIVGI